MNTQASLLDGRELRDQGMKRAVDHAELVYPDWKDQALAFLRGYAEMNKIFAAEDVRRASDGFVPEPPHLRAWGAVIVLARKKGWIRQSGFIQVSNPRAHSANAALWTSNIYE